MSALVTEPLPLLIRPERTGDAGAIDRLHERAFGPGRFARTAFRLRERAGETPAFCFTASVGTLLVGSLRMSPLRLGDEDGLLLGPLAVEPAFEGRGIGAALIRAGTDAARADGGVALVLLVGDEPYYGRFGFGRVPAGRLTLPAPVDPARLLWAEIHPGAAERAAGPVRGR